jgi:hypothetical protein
MHSGLKADEIVFAELTPYLYTSLYGTPIFCHEPQPQAVSYYIYIPLIQGFPRVRGLIHEKTTIKIY